MHFLLFLLLLRPRLLSYLSLVHQTANYYAHDALETVPEIKRTRRRLRLRRFTCPFYLLLGNIGAISSG